MNDLSYWAIQGVGALVIVLSMTSFQMRQRRYILLLQIIALLMSCSYFFLSCFVLHENVLVAGCLDVIAMGRTIVFYFEDRKWASSPLWLAAFLLVMTGMGIYMWQTPWDILVITQMDLSTVGFWMKKERYIRLLCLGVGILGIIYGIANHTPMSVLNESLALGSIILGMIRYDRKKQA